ncbi:MAG: DNA primase [Proteobacteria bacterium]|nr:DNA primase [Pseudomonadota bacterium]
MTFSPQFLDEIRTRVPLSDIVGRRVKLTKRGKEHLGLCPFHNEKTPSFTVNDDKAFYHCFGCQAHGSAFDFVMNTEGLSFPEAVERLAGQAGLTVPASTPAAAEAARKQATLYDVMEKAAGWFQAQLLTTSGTAARQYLEGRGLDKATIETFRLGLAPQSRGALKDALLARGVSEEQMLATGLLIKPEDGRATYDRYRHRIIFPIDDTRGRVIAFGGRALGDAKAKYINSPETVLFHKGSVLFGLSTARAAIREQGNALVAEGYMDVIALHAAGFTNAVAPLGTALTEDQMGLLWRLAPEPVLCLDGDAAGQRAALAAAERALPLLRPGHSLRFAELPRGEDPDSLIQKHGPSAMTEVLERALHLDELLWRKERGARRVDSPERQAGLRARLEALVRQITDQDIRDAYQRLFKARFDAEFRTEFRPQFRPEVGPRREREGGRAGAWSGPAAMAARPSAELLRSALTQRSGEAASREAFLAGVIVNHPELMERVSEAFAQLTFQDTALDRLRSAILKVFGEVEGLDTGALKNHLKRQGFGEFVDRLAKGAGSMVPIMRGEAPLEEIERIWRDALALHGRPILHSEIKSAWSDFNDDSSDAARDRVRNLQEELGGAEGVTTRGNLLKPTPSV